MLDIPKEPPESAIVEPERVHHEVIKLRGQHGVVAQEVWYFSHRCRGVGWGIWSEDML